MSAHSAKQINRRAKRPTPKQPEESRAILRRIEARLSQIEPGYVPRKWRTPKL